MPLSRLPGGLEISLWSHAAALSALILALIEGPQIGWGAPLNVAAYAAFALLLAAFVVVEWRQARPRFDLSLFTKPPRPCRSGFGSPPTVLHQSRRDRGRHTHRIGVGRGVWLPSLFIVSATQPAN